MAFSGWRTPVSPAFGLALAIILVHSACGGSSEGLQAGYGGSSGPTLAAASDAIASQLKSSFRGGFTSEPRVVVADFVDPRGEACAAGTAIASEVSAALFRVGGFRVMERAELPRILEELALSTSDLMVAETAARIGEGIGASLFVTGVVSGANGVFEVSARIINVESFEVVGVARTAIGSSEVTSRGGCAGLGVSAAPVEAMAVSMGGGAGATSAARPSQPPPNALYFEDFSQIPDGEAPPAWTGVESYAVRRDSDQRVPRATFAPFRNGSARFVIQHGIESLPESFSVDVVIDQEWSNSEMWGGNDGSQVHFALGNVSWSIQWHGGGAMRGQIARIGDSSTWIPRGTLPDSGSAKVSLLRRGNILRVLIDDREVALARVTSFTPSASLIIDITGGPGSAVVSTRAGEPRLLSVAILGVAP